MNIAPLHATKPERQEYTSQLRILIVDDDALMRRLIQHMIERTKLNCSITVAEDGHEAWQLYQQEGADLIITDNCMPLMDGIALTKAIRQERPEVPIIMVSGSPEVRPYACAAGASLFLHKPFELNCLQQTIMHCLFTNTPA
jgi:CheY-like chemotaxis protein